MLISMWNLLKVTVGFRFVEFLVLLLFELSAATAQKYSEEFSTDEAVHNGEEW